MLLWAAAVLLPDFVHVATVAQPPQCLAELAEGEFAIRVEIEALPPGRDHGAVGALTQLLELLGRVDAMFRCMHELPGLCKLLFFRDCQRSLELDVKSGCLSLVECHLQCPFLHRPRFVQPLVALPLLLQRRVRPLGEHPDVAAAEGMERLGVKVLQGEEAPAGLRLHLLEKRLRVDRAAAIRQGGGEFLESDLAGAVDIQTFHPRQQQIPMFFGELRPHVCHFLGSLWIQIREVQEVLRLGADAA
mmetsp:Transcript_91201/g.294796  ORF Transcript_91201/g.294796 Transcript_91201/m.294796 type:complete len:246 (+) Transcript_91201:1845-2582(+)